MFDIFVGIFVFFAVVAIVALGFGLIFKIFDGVFNMLGLFK
jgi:hypothetical protein